MAYMDSIDSDEYGDSDFENHDDSISVYSNASLSFDRTESFRVITSDDVFGQMNKEMRIISEALNIPPTNARIILDRHNWQAQSVMDKFLASENDGDAFFRDARILNPRNYCDYKGRGTVAECLICFDTSEITGLQCGHKFCRGCWKQYLTTKIVEYGEQTVACPDSKCNIIIEDGTVKSLVSDPDVLVKYNRLICNNFVKCKKNLYWCNSPGCNYVIDSYDITNKFVTCKCGNQFCNECYDEIHAPISCEHLKKWRSGDSATQSYLSAHTKACPNCHVDIEKNGGCPHMVCRNCQHQFCWKCLKSWLKHNASYKCTTTTEDDMKIRKNRTREERLKYCWNRYAYNHQSLKDEIERFDIIWEQFEDRFVLKASLNKILGCRRFLMYSYAFVYYLTEGNEVYILEAALDTIEAKVDVVSVLLEEYIRLKENDEDFSSKESELRLTIVDSAEHRDSEKRKWMKETDDGYATNTWEYRDD